MSTLSLRLPESIHRSLKTLAEREAGGTADKVLGQVVAALSGRPAAAVAGLVVAYEPIWAIGTGEVATPEDAQEVCAAIRTKLGELFGGDVADGIRVLAGMCLPGRA